MNKAFIQVAQAKTASQNRLTILIDSNGWFRFCYDVAGAWTFTDHKDAEELFDFMNSICPGDPAVKNIRRQIIDLTSDVLQLDKLRAQLTRTNMSKLRQDIYAKTKAR